MISKAKRLLYISGPPCAGKSTVSKALLRELKSTQYILGDNVWTQNEQHDFIERIEKTNQDIISSIQMMTSNKVLLEWVPSFGQFIENLRSICEIKEYEFIHIVITAPKDVLEIRKFNRDGNIDLGPVDLDKYADLENVILFDSSIESVDAIVSACIGFME